MPSIIAKINQMREKRDQIQIRTILKSNVAKIETIRGHYRASQMNLLINQKVSKLEVVVAKFMQHLFSELRVISVPGLILQGGADLVRKNCIPASIIKTSRIDETERVYLHENILLVHKLKGETVTVYELFKSYGKHYNIYDGVIVYPDKSGIPESQDWECALHEYGNRKVFASLVYGTEDGCNTPREIIILE